MGRNGGHGSAVSRAISRGGGVTAAPTMAPPSSSASLRIRRGLTDDVVAASVADGPSGLTEGTAISAAALSAPPSIIILSRSRNGDGSASNYAARDAL